MNDGTTNDPRVYFAAEQTFLAWIRTGLALMGFGFVVARFGIFLQELLATRDGSVPPSSGLSVMLGIFLLAIGVAVNIAAAWRHVLLIRALKSGEPLAIKPSILAIALALVLAIAGLVMAVYLLHARSVSLPSHGRAGPSANATWVRE